MFVSFVPGCLTYRALRSLFGLYPVPCWGPFLLVAWAVEQCLFLWILLSPGAHHDEVLFLAVYHPSGLLVVVYHDTALPQCFFLEWDLSLGHFSRAMEWKESSLFHLDAAYHSFTLLSSVGLYLLPGANFCLVFIVVALYS